MKKLAKKITALLLCAMFLFSSPIKTLAAEPIDETSPNNQRAINRYFSDVCPIGVPDNYTVLVGSSITKNITLSDRDFYNLTQSGVANALAGAVGTVSSAAGYAASCFLYAAQNCIEAQAFNDSDQKAMSIKIMIFRNPSHSTGTDEYFRYLISYYSSANCVGHIGALNYYETIHYT